MPMTKDQILAEAMSLEPSDREALAEELLTTVDYPTRGAVDAAWADEIDRRLAEYDSGKVQAVSPDQMFRRLREKYGK
jgi:putative addiction module component (TIGR02574 family)